MEQVRDECLGGMEWTDETSACGQPSLNARDARVVELGIAHLDWTGA